MKQLNLAIFTGLITGILIGLIDSISRLVAVKFEWFEFYQTLVLSTVVMLIIFIILSILIGIASKKFRVTKKGSSLFYFASAIAFLIIFYAGTVTHFFFTKISSPSLRNIGIIALILFVAALIFVSILTIFKKCVLRFFFRCKKRNIPQLIYNIIFAITVFVVVSFALDLYFINSEPGFSPTGLDAPNVILISLDTVRADHLTMYNYSRDTTPNLARFAEKSIVFDNAISASSWTLPGHASFLTGKYPFNHNANNLHHKIGEEQTTLAEVLRNKGYNTAGFQAGHFTKAKFGFGQGFNLYKDRTDFYDYITSFSKLDIITAISLVIPNIHELLGSDGELTAEEMNNMIIPWLNKNKDDPFFLFAVYFDAHDPYTLGDYSRFSNGRQIDVDDTNKLISLPRNSEIGNQALADLIVLYDTELFYLDQQLGVLFDELERLNLMDNSIIIITSDHGEEFYEHGGFGHLQTLYEEVIHVPLIIYYPDVVPRQIKKRVENMNIFPTVLDMVAEVPENLDSISLLPLMEKNLFERDYSYAELFGRKKYDELNQKAVTIKNWKLITIEPENDEIPSSVFNLATDPKEKRNLYDSALIKEDLQKKINHLLPK